MTLDQLALLFLGLSGAILLFYWTLNGRRLPWDVTRKGDPILWANFWVFLVTAGVCAAWLGVRLLQRLS